MVYQLPSENQCKHCGRVWLTEYLSEIKENTCIFCSGEEKLDVDFIARHPEHRFDIVQYFQEELKKQRKKDKDQARKERNKEWLINNKDHVAEYRKNYYEKNKEIISERNKKWNNNHKEKRNAYQRKYDATHKEKRNAYQRKYYALKKMRKQWDEMHPEKQIKGGV